MENRVFLFLLYLNPDASTTAAAAANKTKVCHPGNVGNFDRFVAVQVAYETLAVASIHEMRATHTVCVRAYNA